MLLQIKEHCLSSFAEFEKTFRTMLGGFMQNHACARRQEKQAPN
jgi:hypothetical protein